MCYLHLPRHPLFRVINNFKWSLICFSFPSMSISIITLNAQFITRLFLIWRKDLLQSASWNAIPGYYWNHHLRWTEDSTSEENYIFLTKHIYFSGLPGAPEDCRVSRETNDSLTVLCSPGWSGGLPQTFHLGKNKTKYFRLWPKVCLKFAWSLLEGLLNAI